SRKETISAFFPSWAIIAIRSMADKLSIFRTLSCRKKPSDVNPVLSRHLQVVPDCCFADQPVRRPSPARPGFADAGSCGFRDLEKPRAADGGCRRESRGLPVGPR